jgi:hypothetical protein
MVAMSTALPGLNVSGLNRDNLRDGFVFIACFESRSLLRVTTQVIGQLTLSSCLLPVVAFSPHHARVGLAAIFGALTTAPARSGWCCFTSALELLSIYRRGRSN